MYHGKYETKRKPSLLTWVLLCAALLATLIGGVSAYLSMSAGPATNNFSTALHPTVTVAADGQTVTVDTDGYAVYLRVAVDACWKNSENVILAEEPEITFDVTDSGWVEIGGFYYYTSKLVPSSPSGVVSITLPITKPTTEKTGYDLVLNVAAQVIQALGETDEGKQSAMENAWGVKPEDLTTPTTP